MSETPDQQPQQDSPQPIADLGDALAGASPEANRAPVPASPPPTADVADTAAEENEEIVDFQWVPTQAQLAKAQYGDTVTTKVVQRLLTAFRRDDTVAEAVRYAGISRDAFYRAMNQNPVFALLIEDAQGATLKLARNVVRKSLKDGDPVTARWYNDKRDERFKPQQSVASQFNQYNQFVIGDGRTPEERKPHPESTVVDTQPKQ